MPEQEAQGEEGGPVLEHGRARRGPRTGVGNGHLHRGPETRLALGKLGGLQQALDV